MTETADRINISLWLLFVVTFFSNAFGGAISTLMSVYLPEVVNELVESNQLEQLGDISAYINALYLLGWTLGGFLWGLISDRIGRLLSFHISFALLGASTLVISFVSSWEMVVLFRLLSGFCTGGILVITNTYLSEVWPVKTRSIFIGFLSIGFPVGIVTAGMINFLFHDWRTGFGIGLFPLVIAFFSIMVIKEIKREDEIVNKNTLLLSLRTTFNDNHQNLIKGSIIFGSMLIGLWAIFSWLPTWVQSLLIDSDGQQERSLCMMLLGLGGLTGGFFSGWISGSIGLRKTMLICFTGCLVTSLILFGTNHSFSDIIYLETAVLAIFFGISQGSLATYIPQLFPSFIRGTSTGFCYNTGRVFTTAAVFFVGMLVTFFGGYSETLLAFSGIFLIGLITIYFSSDLKIKT